MSSVMPDREGEAGFTLIEVLICLAIVAASSALVWGQLSKQSPLQDLDRAVSDMEQLFKRARFGAIGGAKPVDVVFDLQHRAASLKGTNSVVTWSPKLTATIETARASDNTKALRMRFYPDGASSGGKMTFDYGSIRSSITVSWLTGSIAVQKEMR